MRSVLFAKRNSKEILREPINFFFGLGFPLILLVLLSVINANLPTEANNPMFEISNLAPGLAMFGTTFMALLTGMLLAKDKTTSFLMRLFTSPMNSANFLVGYTIPVIVMSFGQAAITLFVALLFGLQFSGGLFLAILVTGITAILFIAIGLLCGTLLSDKVVSGVCGALLTNMAGWLSGVFIPLDLIGGGFAKFCRTLPFYHSVSAIKAALNNDFMAIFPHLGVVIAYGVIIYGILIFVFNRRMRHHQ